MAAAERRILLHTLRPTAEHIVKVSLSSDTDRTAGKAATGLPTGLAVAAVAAAAPLGYISAVPAMVVLDRRHARPHTTCFRPPSLRDESTISISINFLKFIDYCDDKQKNFQATKHRLHVFHCARVHESTRVIFI